MPFLARSALEIPKPKDWQAFQRLNVLLFKAALNDPLVREYGRNGQDQHGIDLEGCRNGAPDRRVSVQCRRVEQPLKKKTILADSRRALEHFDDLTEILFACTAPDDTAASDAAREVEKELRSEGRNVRVVVLGWDSVQNLIAEYPHVHAEWHPALYAAQGLLKNPLGSEIVEGKVDQILALVQHQQSVISISTDIDSANSSEDPPLHRRIDSCRDLIQAGEWRLAQSELEALLGSSDFSAKPWAHFRILTNLAAAALELGDEPTAIKFCEQAHALRPKDSKSIANLAMARLVGREFGEAIELAEAALAAVPRADAALVYLLQALARTDWQGDAKTRIPAGLEGSEDAAIGLAEFARIREKPGWAQEVLRLVERQRPTPIIRRIKAHAVLTLASENNLYVPGGHVEVEPADIEEAAQVLLSLSERQLRANFQNSEELIATLNNTAVALRFAGRLPEVEAFLRSSVAKVGPVPTLVRLHGLVLASSSRLTDAVLALEQAADLDAAISWAEANAEVRPVLATDDLPDEFLEILKRNPNHVLDALIVAHQSARIVITDDAALRAIVREAHLGSAVWLHAVFANANRRHVISDEVYVRWTASLIDAGQSAIGVNEKVLEEALHLDLGEGAETPGWHLRGIAKALGGTNADPASHARVVALFIRSLWSQPFSEPARQRATGHVLRQLVRDRTSDYAVMLRVVAGLLGEPRAFEYLVNWTRGHFVPEVFRL